MMPRRARQPLQRVRRSSLAIALTAFLLSGTLLGVSSLATAQSTSPGQDPTFFPATGYRIASPAIFSYFQHRGGLRTLGYPISSEFPLLGRRVQLFQRGLLQVQADGSVSPQYILDPSILPITHMDGLSLPAPDPDLLAQAPSPTDADYQSEALSFISAFVPDEWNGLPVNFQTTYVSTVSCQDAFGSDACDPSLLPGFALELWGLPTSQPMADPANSDFVYQRFQGGIMHYSNATSMTEGLLVGDWLKRVMLGTNLSPDAIPDAQQSRFYAQYAPSRPLAVDRPNLLPDTSLAQAFNADTLSVAQQLTNEPTLPIAVAQTATAVAQTATAIAGTQVSLTSSQTMLTATAQAGTATALAITAPVTAPGGIGQTPTPLVQNTSSIPVVNVGCLGDEQMWFVPRKPFIGTHVNITVTSQRHHDVRFMLLAGAQDPGAPVERQGPLGFEWTWTVVPAVEDFYQWTFYADGLRPCITSGYNAYAPLGATATPTATPLPTNTPGTATPTPTNTPVPAPTVTGVSNAQSLACGQLITITGSNFGTPPSSFGTNVILTNGGNTFVLSLVGTGSNTTLLVNTPSATGAITASLPSTIVVANNGGNSSPVPVKFASNC